MYNYETEKTNIFTDEGQREFIKVRDEAKRLLKEAGAFSMLKPLKGVTGSSWTMIRFGTNWKETKTEPDSDGDIWVEHWYTDITFHLFSFNEWRCCMAKYDGAPYFLFIFFFVMFRFGKAGHWD